MNEKVLLKIYQIDLDACALVNDIEPFYIYNFNDQTGEQQHEQIRKHIQQINQQAIESGKILNTNAELKAMFKSGEIYQKSKRVMNDLISRRTKARRKFFSL